MKILEPYIFFYKGNVIYNVFFFDGSSGVPVTLATILMSGSEKTKLCPSYICLQIFFSDMSQLKGCILALALDSYFSSFIMKHPVNANVF